MKNTPQIMNFRKCTSQMNFTVCSIILLLLGEANSHSISHALCPWFNKAVSVLFTSHLFWATSCLHFFPTVFKLLPVWSSLCPFSSLSSRSWNNPNHAPCSLNKWFSNAVAVSCFVTYSFFSAFLAFCWDLSLWPCWQWSWWLQDLPRPLSW